MWEVAGSLGRYSRQGVDASGWLWEITRSDEAKRVLVEVSGTALAVAAEFLPEDTRAAIETEGESEVRRVLALDDPPRLIACGTFGCRIVAPEDLAP